MAPAHLFTFKYMYVYVLFIPYHSLLEKRNNNIKHGESMSILAPLLQTANKLTSTLSTTFIYPPFIKHGHFPHPPPGRPSVADATIAGSYSGSVPHDTRVWDHSGGTVAGGPKKVRAVQVGPKDPGVGLT